jgi:hypothetical protein
MRRTTCFLVILGMFSPLMQSARPSPESAGSSFDAAPHAVSQRAEEGRAYQLRWNEPRLIRSVEVEFASQGALPAKEDLRLRYWNRYWKGQSATPLAERNPCGNGWIRADDWYNGTWIVADTKTRIEGRRFTFTFLPTDKKEFPLAKTGTTYRQTLKLQLCGDALLPPIARIRAWTDAMVQPLQLKLDFGEAQIHLARNNVAEECSLEIVNGTIEHLRAAEESGVRVTADRCFVLPPSGKGRIELDVLAALDPHEEQADRTVVTVRSPLRSFSFAPEEVLCGGKIFVNDLGVLITLANDPTTLASWQKTTRERGLLTIRDRVAAMPEQTLSHAWDDMPLKHKIPFVHGLPGDRNVFRQDSNGDLSISNWQKRFQWQTSPSDTKRRPWANDLRMGWRFPGNTCGGRELLEGSLPVLRMWWIEGPLFYEQLTVLDTLRGNVGRERVGRSSSPDDIRLDDPTVLLMKVRIHNTSPSDRATARLTLFADDEDTLHADRKKRRDSLSLVGENVWGQGARKERQFRYLWKNGGKGTVVAGSGRLAWSLELSPGQSLEMFFAVPSVTLTEEKEIAALGQRSFEADCRRIADFWRSRNPESTQIHTPEPWLNDFYKAHLLHMEINCLCDLKSPRRYATVGTHHYMVYPNESSMMISDLDRRGLSQLAEQCLQTWLDFQGKEMLPGNYRTSEGLFNSGGDYRGSGYNKGHGYVLWCLAEHWKYTRDRRWLERVAPQIVAGCDWIIRERRATMTANADGSRPIEYGFLPAGALEDVKDFWYWQATNSATVWGFEAAAAALAEIGHTESPRLQKEARAYHDDVMRGLTESRILTPVVRLRDGTSVPKYPSHLHLRGRAAGWIRETLEGSMFLPVYGLLAPQAPESSWILNDYEDNLYISRYYGYDVPTFDPYWFSRGGFSMQANLLDGPLPYLYRDEIKHYVRAFFNGFASAFDPELRMLNEHSKPELGYFAGDHFKTSDEAQLAYWLRLMFVRESGDELYLGQAIPRYWLTDGNTIGIHRARTHFGPMSLQLASKAKTDEIRATYTPPERNPPRTAYLRLRHPQEKRMRSVTVNGKAYDRFDPQKEWIVLAGNVRGVQEIVARY